MGVIAAVGEQNARSDGNRLRNIGDAPAAKQNVGGIIVIKVEYLRGSPVVAGEYAFPGGIGRIRWCVVNIGIARRGRSQPDMLLLSLLVLKAAMRTFGHKNH